MKALTVRQPWVQSILHLGKPVENRKWRTSHRGLTALHASAGMSRADRNMWCDCIRYVFGPEAGRQIIASTDMDELPRGAIVGVVTIKEVVDAHDSRWFFGPYGFVLENPLILPRPIPCGGFLNLWTVPPDVEAEIKTVLDANQARPSPVMELINCRGNA